MKIHYFADYEVQVGASLVRWGNATVSYEPEDGAEIDPDAIVRRVRAQAADKYGVPASEVRLRNLCRL